MQLIFLEILQESFISLKINNPLGKLLSLNIGAAIVSDQLDIAFDLIGKHRLIDGQTQTVFGGIQLGLKLPLLRPRPSRFERIGPIGRSLLCADHEMRSLKHLLAQQLEYQLPEGHASRVRFAASTSLA